MPKPKDPKIIISITTHVRYVRTSNNNNFYSNIANKHDLTSVGGQTKILTWIQLKIGQFADHCKDYRIPKSILPTVKDPDHRIHRLHRNKVGTMAA